MCAGACERKEGVVGMYVFVYEAEGTRHHTRYFQMGKRLFNQLVRGLFVRDGSRGTVRKLESYLRLQSIVSLNCRGRREKGCVR